MRVAVRAVVGRDRRGGAAFLRDLGKFVMTGAYQSSAHALVEHGFVLLLGEPACGKSAIAAGPQK